MISVSRKTSFLKSSKTLAEYCYHYLSCGPTVLQTLDKIKVNSGSSNESKYVSSISIRTCANNPVLHNSRLQPANTNHSRYCSSELKFSKFKDSEKKRTIGSLSASLVESSPIPIKPYLRLMRVDRPIGTWLLFWPCGWSIAMAAAPGCLPPLDILALFGAGAFVMRSAGCTINDMWDKDIDGKVERTKDRPLVSGALSQWDALVFLSGQLGLGLLILLQLNWYSVLLGASSLGLVVLYPLMKRVTYWPQLILGMTFNWGALLGWSAVHGACDWSVCLPLYTAGICWTIVYDTIYAHQDKADDLKLGIKSTALKFGDNTKAALSVFSSAMVTGLIVSGSQCCQTWPFYSSVAVVAVHLANQLYTLNIDNPSDCGKKFLSNQRVGLVLFIGMVLGNLLKKPSDKKATAPSDNPVETSIASDEPREASTVSEDQ